MPATLAIEWEAPPLVEPRRDPELERAARKRFGLTPPSLRYLLAVPWVAELSNNLYFGRWVQLSFDLDDLVFLVVSRDNSCRLCYSASRVLLRIMGFPDTRINAIEEDLFTAELDARERLALDFVRRISRSNPLASAEDKKVLRDAGYSGTEIKELAFAAVRAVGGNRLTTLLALPPEFTERLANTRLLGLVRPFLRRRFERLRQHGEAESLPDELKTGPFTYLVQALDGLPIARSLREMLDACWSSRILSSRAKALVFAVVARGLGCPHSEEEALRLLEDEGLKRSKTEEILAHLGSAELDPIEATIVPYARETIRYRHPADIQRRGREVRAALSEEQFLELIGVATLANMVCRLAIVLNDA